MKERTPGGMTDEHTAQDDLFERTEEQPPADPPRNEEEETAPETLPMMISMPPQDEIPMEPAGSPPLIFSDHAPFPTRSGVLSEGPEHRKHAGTQTVKKEFTPLSADRIPENASVGTILRLAREAAGYEIPQVREMTRISDRFLALIEQDKTDENVIPAVYLSAYLRSLCSVYRLPGDVAELVEELHRRGTMTKDAVSQDLIEKLRSDALVNEEERKRVTRIFSAAAVLAGLLILLGVWAVVAAVIRSEGSAEKQASAQTVQTEPAAPAVVPEQAPFDQKQLEVLNAEQITDLYTLEMSRNPAVRRDWNRKR